jgi:hypothetical protein
VIYRVKIIAAIPITLRVIVEGLGFPYLYLAASIVVEQSWEYEA